VSDVTAEELALRATQALRLNVTAGYIHPVILAAVREARREALREAAEKAFDEDCGSGDCCSCSIYAAAAIRALLGPET
jgi:hypothetical protein